MRYNLWLIARYPWQEPTTHLIGSYMTIEEGKKEMEKIQGRFVSAYLEKIQKVNNERNI